MTSEPSHEELENHEWRESLDGVLAAGGPTRVTQLLELLRTHAVAQGVRLPVRASTPYVNTIGLDEQPPYPGSREIERRIKSIVRWNAMAMVVRANREHEGIGGHISTYASAATLLEVAFNHFLRGPDHEEGADLVYFQGHASPGIYARAFLEGRLVEAELRRFRQEARGEGLSSYPHPWLMPEFWQFPTVSMGLAPIQAIYQARFLRYLEHRGLRPGASSRVWAFVGDGETDEPESLGALTLASREKLDNLIFVVNCNLQRLDGPVRGNGKIIQELEAAFRGAGWNVIKVIWGTDWDPLLEQDDQGLLLRRMEEACDGDYQKYVVAPGSYTREHFFGTHPRLSEMVAHLSDEQISKLRRGGHDPQKVHAAYAAAVAHQGSPTVILAKTIKGYGLGEGGEGRNVTHQQKKLNEDELRAFRSRFGIPISDDEVAQAPFYRPPEDSPELRYMLERRQALGGSLPSRRVTAEALAPPDPGVFAEFHRGTEGREASTTMVFVRLLAKLLRDGNVGSLVVPIVPDEARTFGMEPLFRQCGIYASSGQRYDPVDSDSLLYYREAKDGQILEEGITEAGSMCSFIAAGTSYATLGINTIPFFIYYSMFGFQRIGDLAWAAAEMRVRGFMLGGTAGRTTLNGEGLQHQDGHSHLLAYPVPNLRAYDPAYAFELAVIIEEGLRRMYVDGEPEFYYITLTNENHAHPPMPEGARQGIVDGMYLLRPAEDQNAPRRAQLLGSGTILHQVLRAQEVLAERYGVAADVWSVTSYKELRREALAAERETLLHPAEAPQVPRVTRLLEGRAPVVVAATDYDKALPDLVTRWVPGRFSVLGTDGFGRSDTREALRDFFEVDHRYVTLATLAALHREGQVEAELVQKAMRDLEIDPDHADPLTC